MVSMKNKTLLTILFSFILFIIILLFVLFYNNHKKQFCTATVYSDFRIPGHYSSYRVDMKIAKNSDKSGYIDLLGTITVDKVYSINRIIYFDLRPSVDNNKLDISIKTETKAKNDNISDEIFDQYFKFFSLDSGGYVVINEITPELYLFSSSLGPYFVCMQQEELTVI